MSPQVEHVAKLRAIEALEAGKLSASGTARLQKHLGACELCQQTRRGLRVHAQLSRELRDEEPVIDFARIELALRREAKVVSRRTRMSRAAWLSVGVAAVVALAASWALLPASRAPSAEQHATPHTQPAAPAPLARVLQARVTALSGHGSMVDSRAATQAARALVLSSIIDEGAQLTLEAHSQAHLRIDDHTGFVIEERSKLTLQELREDSVVLALADGAVTSQVRKLGARDRYEVHALGYTVAVRGTHFRVAAVSGKLFVSVEEGHVVITDASGHVVSDLRAPASYGGAQGSGQSATTALTAPRLLRLPLADWPVLALPVLRDVRSVTLDGSTFAASAELAMRVPQGEVTLHAKLNDGRERSTVLQVPEGGLVLEATLLRRLLRLAENDRGATPTDPNAISKVIAQGTPALQRCYERSLKQRPDIGGRFVLRISIDQSGRVRSVAPRGDAHGLPAELVTCMRDAAQRWAFPSGTHGLTFDAPIRLQSGH